MTAPARLFNLLKREPGPFRAAALFEGE